MLYVLMHVQIVGMKIFQLLLEYYYKV